MPLFDKLIQCPFCLCKYLARTNYVDKKHEEISSHQNAVNKFMELGGQELPPKPVIPSLEVRKLRAKLILEEACETIAALGFEINITPSSREVLEVWEPNLVEIIDGCCDLRVVTTGTLSACGIKDIRPQELVDENNLEKFKWTDEEIKHFFNEEGVKPDFRWSKRKVGEELYTVVFRKDGKIIKPPSHTKVNLASEIERQNKL